MSESETKKRLIENVKKVAKQLMEESVTKKYIHEESSSVTELCAAVESCLSHGIRRRALGLFKTSSTTALLHKISKQCPEAEQISKKVQEIEACDPAKRSSSSSDSFNRPAMLKKASSTTVNTTTSSSGSPASIKFLWIRLALYEKCLQKIIEHLVTNARTYYDRDSFIADSDFGPLLVSLLEGTCSLEFTRAKTVDHYWTDPHADELIQRHRISSGRRSSSACSRPPVINFKRSLTTSIDDASNGTFKSIASVTSAKDYVESLHQNSRASLLYGKNNVHVMPKDLTKLMPGYLSLHQHIQTLTIKWTPNQLMNDYNNTDDDIIDKESYWAYALNINVDEIVYVHCHQSRDEDSGGTVILVGQDGVQRPPIHFPEGGHMQQFLGCLEAGLLPNGQLDPPLWTHRGIGKLLPRIVRRRILPSVMESFDETPIDYVFRIVSKSKYEEFVATHSILDFVRSTPRRKQLSSCSTTGSSDCSSKSISIDQFTQEASLTQVTQSTSIKMVCSTMRRQIISRAFYGWLAYYRHLKTVRTHLSDLVYIRDTPEELPDEKGLTKERWEQLNVEGVIVNKEDFFRYVYNGGVDSELRKEVWPYILGHYSFGSTPAERQAQDEACKLNYEMTISKWMAVDAIVQQIERENTAAAVAKNSSGSTSGNEKTVRAADLDAAELENDVFEDKSDTSEWGELKFDEEQQQEEVPVTSSSYLNVKPIPRAMKTSTDSGNVDEAPEDEDDDFEDNVNLDNNKVIDAGIDDIKMTKVRTTDEKEEEHAVCEKVVKANQSLKSSPQSSSSYETVANGGGFDEVIPNASTSVNMSLVDIEDLEPKSVLSPEYLSADDLPAQLVEDANEEKKHKEYENEDFGRVIITEVSVDFVNWKRSAKAGSRSMSPLHENTGTTEGSATAFDALQDTKSASVSTESTKSATINSDIVDKFGKNMVGIKKDVLRCDRNYWYFANENLDKLRNVMATFAWNNLDFGYKQGMCDLIAPLLVIFDDESLSYSCFCKLMERNIHNFPNGVAMDMHFANMRSLIQILDPALFEVMDANNEYSSLFFCFRWFLLDFKRELVYDDVFTTWEVIWAAKHVASNHFILFLALALLDTYRDIILANSMDYMDVVKFFNEMAERHNGRALLQLARCLVHQLQMQIDRKDCHLTDEKF